MEKQLIHQSLRNLESVCLNQDWWHLTVTVDMLSRQ